ncbi:MAG: hypothetical protein WA793_15925, partial [Sphingorhabdus sp.]|uniref:hypothetical protein n=1 Tax=Sphingorhabdus sp. TaxID=1902408 RepID=UPI003CBE3752
TESGTEGATVTAIENVRTEQSGDASSVTAPTPPSATAAALAALPGGTVIGQDPMLRYLAATAVYQEVNLLNRYITDAVRFRGAQAFLVRLQLSVLPAQRALPYDVTTDITIHADDLQARAGLGRSGFDADEFDKVAWQAATQEQRDRITAEANQDLIERKEQLRQIDATRIAQGGALNAVGLAKDEENAQEQMTLGSGGFRRCLSGSDAVTVVPLVVTDNLEGLAAARSTDVTRQLALALLATAGNVGLGGEFAQTQQQLRRQEGRDTNSLFTVARLTDDTVRVRLGAAQSPRYGNAMLARTHNISLLVIFKPCRPDMLRPDGEERALSVVTRAAFTDTQTGETLRYRPAGERLIGLTSELNRKYNNKFTYLEYAALYQMVTQQNRTGFAAFFKEKLDRFKGRECDSLSPGSALGSLFAPAGISGRLDPDEVAAIKKSLDSTYADLPSKCMSERLAFQVASAGLWTDLQSIRPVAEYSYTSVPLVLRRVSPTPPPTAQLVLANVADSGITATLYNGRDLGAAKEIRGSLFLTTKKGESYELQSTSATVAADGATITLKFPAIASNSDLSADGLKLGPVSVDFGLLPDGIRIDSARYAQVLPATPKAQPKMAFTLSAPAQVVVIDTSGKKGALAVFVRAETVDTPPKNAILTVDGPQVVSISKGGTSLAQKGSGWAFTDPGEYVIQLDNLMAGQNVNVAVSDIGDGGKETVVAAKLTRSVFDQRRPAKAE